MSLKKELQNKWHDIVHSFTGGALDFFEALATSIEASGGQILRDAAINAVKAAETNGGSGKAKFDAAYAQVVSTLQAEGIPFLVSAVNGAIEAAVAKIKGA